MTEGVIFVAGEALVNLIAEPDGSYRPAVGGSPANVAIGLARLDAPAQMLARIGAGTMGTLIHQHLAANQVGLDYAIDADELPSIAIVSLNADGDAAYDFYADGTADWQWNPDELPDPLPAGTLALCTGSIAAARQPGSPALLQLLRREHARNTVSIVLDPNLRPSLLGDPEEVREHWDGLVELADIVKASEEDLAWLVPQVEPLQIAKGWAECGPALIVVTRGGAGSLAATSAGVVVSAPAQAADVADTVGAGDAFTAGLVDSLRRRDLLGAEAHQRLAEISADELQDVLDRASRAAALTCARHGADPPTSAELDRK